MISLRRLPGQGSKPVPRLEKLEQRECVRLFQSVGCVVHSTSQYRAAGITPGMPDLYVVHRRKGVWFWFEVKKAQRTAGFDPFDRSTWIPEPLRPAQLAFRANCLLTHQPHFWGTAIEAQAALITVGLGEMRDGVFWLIAA